ncbi:hypothetical protein MATL_G00022480 [Megalops atlanticus]|uniref:Pyrin domain-containing protein n=1 Tax=Megalops atlanticus TaxID=7932 RepID=A0A9D3QCR6_MEGAT|nr:hypothetical protein MATL_G00022480 [Megalops atlanticus]
MTNILENHKEVGACVQASVMAHLIMNILEELENEGFKKFQLYLNVDVQEGLIPIPWGHLETKSVTDVVTLMMNSYGTEIVKVIVEILKKIPRSDLVQRLEKDQEKSCLTVESQR